MALGGVCLLAGLEKARAPREFFEGVRSYRLVPRALAPAIGSILVAAELVLGSLLVADLAVEVAAAGAILLFGVFRGRARRQSLPVESRTVHCFGASEIETISPVALVRALALVAAICVLPACLRGDDPEALALRPSHASGRSSPSLWRAPCSVGLASGLVQGGLTIEAPYRSVKYLGQVILRFAGSLGFRPRYTLFEGSRSTGTCAEVKYAFDCARGPNCRHPPLPPTLGLPPTRRAPAWASASGSFALPQA